MQMDNIQFENQYEITKELLKSWRKLSQKRSAKHKLWITFLGKVWAGVLVVLCVFAALFFNASRFFGFSLFFFTLLMYASFMPSIVSRQRVKRFLQFSGETTWLHTVCFGEEIVVKSGNSVTTYSYDKIRFIDENEECFYLWVGTNFSIVIYKSKFSVGRVDEFRTFIDEKSSEQEPLWKKRELNKKVLKKLLPRVIALIVAVFATLLYIWFFFLVPNTVSQVVKNQWGNNIHMITVEELPNGAVAFGTDGADSIHAMLLRKSANHYYYIKAHSYSITSIDSYNKGRELLFESKEEALSFSYTKEAIVYGVANFEWWNKNVPESEKRNYTVVSFQCGEVEFVLYYRELTGEKLSVSKYNNITGENYEETSNGYRAVFCSIEEITVDKIRNWLEDCEPNGQYYEYTYSDPDSWDMFIYYPFENKSNKLYESFEFCIVDQTVEIYVESSTSEEPPSEYILIRIQAPFREAWPNKYELIIDGQKIEMGNIQ